MKMCCGWLVVSEKEEEADVYMHAGFTPLLFSVYFLCLFFLPELYFYAQLVCVCVSNGWKGEEGWRRRWLGDEHFFFFSD
jgi:hypothetical protein